jgi:F0F1-type ATP synthase assembly protein I
VKFLGLGFLIPCGVAVGYFGGLWLDQLFHTHFLYIVLLIAGAIGGISALIREAQSKP